MFQDLRFGVRMLRRNPGVSILAVVCLTIGIGATASVFSWIEGILLRPFPLVTGQDRLVALTGTNRGTDRTDVSWPDFKDLERNATLADAFIADKITGSTLTLGDRAERVTGSMVSANYFEAIGVRPILGRGFEAGEDTGRNAHPVAVISYQMWQERFHGAPDVVGQTQILAGLPHTIVGVTPQGFYGTFVGYAFQFWVPASMQMQFDGGIYKLEDRGARWIEGFVRLKPGVSLEQLQSELSAIASRLEANYPDTNRGRGVRLYPLWQTPFNNAGAMLPTLGIALAVVVAVLLIACANVGNLLLVRALTRQHEMTVRVSMGASRMRLVRQLMIEGVLLSFLATIGGLILAHGLQDTIGFLTPPRSGTALRLPGMLDWRVFALTAVLCLGSTLLFALAPAVMTTRVDLAGALRAHGGAIVGSTGRSWVRSALVLIQVAMSLVLLVGAGLLIQTQRAVRTANPGFRMDDVLTTSVDLFTAGYDASRAKTFQNELIDRLQMRAGIESAAFARSTPFSYRSYSSAPIAVEGYDPPKDQQPTADYNEAGPAFLATMGIPLVSGREFTRADTEEALPVAIVDQATAAQFFRRSDPVGRRIQVRGKWLQIVGVARTARYRTLLETPRPFLYVPLQQNFSPVATLHIRTSQGIAAMRPLLVREIQALDANVAPGELITMREQVERTTAPQRIGVTVLIVFAAVALVLASVGLYALMSATVSQSRRELALRLALGANTSELLRFVIFRSMLLTTVGVAAGLAVASQTTRLLGYLLYRVSPRDPAAFGVAVIVLSLASLVACLVPAWRAARTDPLAALRG